MKTTAADYPMIRLMIVLAAGAVVMMLLVAWQEGKLPLAISLSPMSAGAAPDSGSDGRGTEPAGEGYRIINAGTDTSARPADERLALRFKETEAKQGLGSADDQRPRPALSGSNRGKSLKQS
ncbi:MAG: hypothetical protein ACYC63_08230 [Armatimonadota bacterium]